MNTGTDHLLRNWLENQNGVTPELKAMLEEMMGLDGPVIEGTAEEVVPPDAAGLAMPGLPEEATDLAAQIEALRKLTDSDQIDLSAWEQEAARSERIIEALTAKLDMLACALGACPGCWGGDGPCEGCGGRGRGGPGAFLPDPDCFDTFVTPVLHLMAGQTERRHNRTPRAMTPTQPRNPQQQPTLET